MNLTAERGPETAQLDQPAINPIRCLSVDASQKADSGQALLERKGV